MATSPPVQLLPPKTRPPTSCLVKLVVAVPLVMFILSVFTVMVIPVYRTVRKKALVGVAQSHMMSLQASLKAYRAEYGHFPPLPEEQHIETILQRSRGPILAALLGKDSKLNPKGIVFIHPLAAQDHKSGFEEVGGEPVFLDPWGEPYYILLDWNNDELLPDPSHPGTGIDGRVQIFSSGPDHDPKTWSDNVKSW